MRSISFSLAFELILVIKYRLSLLKEILLACFDDIVENNEDAQYCQFYQTLTSPTWAMIELHLQDEGQGLRTSIQRNFKTK